MKPLSSTASTHQKSEKGQALILIVFSIIGLLGMSALAIDGGNAYVDRRRAETAASAAALTASITRIEGGNWRSAALITAETNGYNNDGVTNIVELNTPPINGPYKGNSEYIQVIITSYLDTYFGPVVGVPQTINIAQAVSQSKPAEYGQMFEGYAIVSLAPHSDCQDKIAFEVHGEATISLEGGGLFVNSDNPDCAFVQYGSGSVRIRDDSPFTVVGGADIQKPKLITPFPVQTGAPPIPYPPAFQMPRVGCGDQIAKLKELDETTLLPGDWGSEDFPPEGVTKLESGTYCLSGDFILETGEQLIGNGVMFIMKEGKIKISGGAEINIVASNVGVNGGLLIYMPISNHNVISLNGNINSNYTGTILAPGADIRINGLNSRAGYHSQIIGYYIEVDGMGDSVIKYKDEQNYDAYKMPEVILSQ